MSLATSQYEIQISKLQKNKKKGIFVTFSINLVMNGISFVYAEYKDKNIAKLFTTKLCMDFVISSYMGT